MRREYELHNGATLVVEFTGRAWIATVDAPNKVVCENGIEHDFPVSCTVEIDNDLVDNDKALLTAYEWAIRGDERAAARCVAIIVDDEMYQKYVDPCLVA